MSKRSGNLALGGLLLAGLGYVLGVLTAPKSGKETRKDLQRSAARAKSEAERQLKNAHVELSDLVDQASAKAKDLKSKAKTEMNKAVATAKIAKNKARDVLSAVHEGESDDEELQKAVNEATKAVRHLKAFIKKNA